MSIEGILVTVGLYACFAIIVVGAVLAFPTEAQGVTRHWAGVLPGDTVVVHGDERQVVAIDYDRDAIEIDRPFDWGPLVGEWVSVRHPARGLPPLGAS
jgi:hypothetical protein